MIPQEEIKNLNFYDIIGKLKRLFNLIDKDKVSEAPINGDQFARKNGQWVEVTSGTEGIQSISGETVDNSDPLNPVIDIELTDTSFYIKPYSSTMSVAYDVTKPNFQVTLTGNLNLTITGTSNGDTGIVNLYFSSTETATLNGYQNLIITGDSNMIPVYFTHDTDGLKWYNDSIDLSELDFTYVKQDSAVFYHTTTGINPGTISNTGTAVVGTGTAFSSNNIGSKIIKANGEEAIIATVTDFTHITTVEPFKTNSSNVTYETRHIAVIVQANGTITQYSKGEDVIINTDVDGNVTINGQQFRQNGTVITGGGWRWGNIQIYDNILDFSPLGTIGAGAGGNNPIDISIRRYSGGVLEVNNGTGGQYRDVILRTIIANPANIYANDAAADADTALLAGSLYWITGDRVPRKKP